MMWKDDLKFSEQASDENFWNEIYRVAFPDMSFNILSTAGKSQSQNLGIDRIIHLKSGKTLYIDEKKRRKKWNDILLEYHSNTNNKEKDGWMNKQLHIDYLAYAFMDVKEVYLLNWLQLRRVWLENGKQWVRRFGFVEADNKIYKTRSIPVPIEELMDKMQNSIIIRLNK